MADNLQYNDASTLRVTKRTTELAPGLHVDHVRFADSIAVAIAAASALNTNLLTGVVSDWYDAAAFTNASFHVIGGAGITAGQVVFEQTNSVAVVGVPIMVQEVAGSANPISAATAIAANAQRMFYASLTGRYIRVRISTAFVGGTVSVVACLSQEPMASNIYTVQQAVAANLATLATLVSPTSLFVTSLATTNAQVVRNAACNLMSMVVTNLSAAVKHVKLFNQTAVPVPGTTVPVITVPVPAMSAVTLDFGTYGMRMVGLGLSITNLAPDLDATAVAAGDVKVGITYL